MPAMTKITATTTVATAVIRSRMLRDLMLSSAVGRESISGASNRLD